MNKAGTDLDRAIDSILAAGGEIEPVEAAAFQQLARPHFTMVIRLVMTVRPASSR